MSGEGEERVIVVGAGLVGASMALFLAKRRGMQVTLIERRSDYRASIPDPSSASSSHLGLSADTTRRSINLALSLRGQSALKKLGLLDLVMSHTLPMYHRAMHSPHVDSKITLMPYGTAGEAIYSIDRALLNRVLLDALEGLGPDRVQLLFDTKVKAVGKDGSVTIEDKDGEQKLSSKLVIGADGAYSSVRSSLLRMTRADFSQHYIEHGYKELEIPPSPAGDFQLDPVNALHIWPRHEFMLIALPNPDKSFTCTLFAPYKKFEELDVGGAEAVEAFIKAEFPDTLPLLPNVAKQYTTNPTGALVTMRVNPWNFSDKVVLMGDAAHAIVPFYGQGMNAGLEDTLVFDEVLEACDGNLSKAVPKFAQLRRPAADGIAALSYGNYMEMRSHVASPLFLLRKTVEGVLHRMFPSMWTPLYTMVAFSRRPYHEALEKAERQDRWLSNAFKLLLVAGAGVGAYFAGPEVLRRLRSSSRL